MPLYGLRYLREEAKELERFVRDDLPYLDFQETLNFYNNLRKNPVQIREDYCFLACNDRFFLLTSILGRRDAMHPWVFDRCREVEQEPDGCLDLWARYHYKSSIGTFAGIIQEIIRDPEITICIFSHTGDIAADFLKQVKRELENNIRLQQMFPDVFFENPTLESTWWNEKGLIVKRKGNPKEATVEAWGLVDAQPTGKHFNLLVYDDVVVPKSVTTPEMIAKTTKAWELSDNLGVGEATRKWHFGTRYNFGDTYQQLIDRRIFKVRLYPATHNGKADGKPVFMSQRQWDHVKKTQRSTYPAQMLQNPNAGGEAMFELKWLKPYDIRPALLNIYIMVDPSGGKKKNSDRTAMCVIGIDVHGNKYFLDGFRHRMKLSERWERLKYLYKKWSNTPGVQFVFVGYEKYGMQSDTEYFAEQMQRDKIEFAIEELNWSGPEVNSKADRIKRLQPDIEGTDTAMYFPDIVYHPGIGMCRWKYNEPFNQLDFEPCEVQNQIKRDDGKVIAMPGGILQTKNQILMDRIGTPWRKAQAIKRIDENGAPYDVTIAFFEEMRFAPHNIGHDDLIDAAARLYDMKPARPVAMVSTKIQVVEERYR